ncbi:hypothetical protein BD410DRAFT_806010 [Rickenella mellea]|uniref:Uncharacterized protein n=1 Tax=Rickenella mellea TaxID=50990 RepID=A0A4Y7PVH1_9AGAM|nr:hypothetical protein BD410DRAFT_806010 [Rickenella mellea]
MHGAAVVKLSTQPTGTADKPTYPPVADEENTASPVSASSTCVDNTTQWASTSNSLRSSLPESPGITYWYEPPLVIRKKRYQASRNVKEVPKEEIPRKSSPEVDVRARCESGPSNHTPPLTPQVGDDIRRTKSCSGLARRRPLPTVPRAESMQSRPLPTPPASINPTSLAVSEANRNAWKRPYRPLPKVPDDAKLSTFKCDGDSYDKRQVRTVRINVPAAPPFDLVEELVRLLIEINDPAPPTPSHNLFRGSTPYSIAESVISTSSTAASMLRPLSTQWLLPVPSDIRRFGEHQRHVDYSDPNMDGVATSKPEKSPLSHEASNNARPRSWRCRSGEIAREGHLQRQCKSAPAAVESFKISFRQHDAARQPKLVVPKSALTRRLNRHTLTDPRSPVCEKPPLLSAEDSSPKRKSGGVKGSAVARVREAHSNSILRRHTIEDKLFVFSVPFEGRMYLPIGLQSGFTSATACVPRANVFKLETGSFGTAP